MKPGNQPSTPDPIGEGHNLGITSQDKNIRIHYKGPNPGIMAKDSGAQGITGTTKGMPSIWWKRTTLPMTSQFKGGTTITTPVRDRETRTGVEGKRR